MHCKLTSYFKLSTPSTWGGVGWGLILLFFVACTTDNYETGDGTYSYLKAEFGEVYTDGAAKMKRFVNDDEAAVDFRDVYERDWAKTPDSLYRAYVLYNGKADDKGRYEAFSISQVLVLRPKDVDEMKEEGKTDPVGWESMWESHNHRYLNLALRVMMGDTGEEKVLQKVGVIRESTVFRDDGTYEHHLRLYHDQNGVPEYYSSVTYVSIPLSAYHPGDEIFLTVNTYDGEVTRQFTLPEQ